MSLIDLSLPPDYDLCTPCISSGASTAHNPFHEFFEITEPGRVIVHTVFSGNGERVAPTSGTRQPSNETPATQPAAAQRPAAHLATCDLCDSRIIGERYVRILPLCALPFIQFAMTEMRLLP